MIQPFDVLVVGSGLAGLTAALSVADARRVAVICKRGAADGATDQAQGGIAAVLGEDDDFNRHVADTLAAGAGLCDAVTARSIIEDAPACVAWLAAQGVEFTRAGAGDYHLTQEGGHSRRRVVHADDATGHHIHRALAERAQAHPNITLLEDHVAIDLLIRRRTGDGPRCVGAEALDVAADRAVTITAAATVLATGGAAGLYSRTTNPRGAIGDGLAMARRAGCTLTNLEFVQFHPTCLYHPSSQTFLISEAVRGEGGVLRLPEAAGTDAGRRFMPRYDARAELAPRDIVARAIDAEMRARGLAFVDLDITGQPAEEIRRRFPTIHSRCLALGIDMTRAPIPVAPAAHFTCGGVAVGHSGHTDVDGLYAVGEVACTGLHGANRLASNSLLECVAMGRAVGQDILTNGRLTAAPVVARRRRPATARIDGGGTARYWQALRETMWSDVGIVRSTRGLRRAQIQIEQWREEVCALTIDGAPSREAIELGNALEVASLIAASALSRHESRGAHHNADHPHTEPGLRQPTLLAARRPVPPYRPQPGPSPAHAGRS